MQVATGRRLSAALVQRAIINLLEAVLESNNARPTVTIIGAGIGDVYLVAMLGLTGCKVRLHDIDDSRLKDLRQAKGI
jgi:hypothetical protein